MTRARAEAAAPKVAVAEKAALDPARKPVPAPAPGGGWVAERSCEAFEGLPVLNDRLPVTMIGDEFVIEKGTPGQPGYNSVRGKPAPDGWLALTGYAIGLTGALRGQGGSASFSGRFDGNRYEAQGRLGRRACTLTIYRQP
jgi:hypothetical protein